ncbi:unnamed protein product [Sphenostylis stenocarpa]|uniref:Lipoyl-binding domain-containing protein n=1 Tax=Sphenostylis stenocarpa TaxID=92480 RepID=A0AA86RMI6_9FABA|nr:unnamed protein product [Sphenostylis stenocarpa]
MASSLPPATKATTNFPLTHSFRLSPKPSSLRFPSTKPGHWVSFTRFKAQLSEVALDSSSNATPIIAKSNEEPLAKPSAGSSSSVLATQESVSQFITQVASLVKLVDSRDIVELKMKQYDIELTIRKKEAMPQPAPSPQPAVMYSSLPPAVSPPPSPTPTLASPTVTPTSSPAPKSTKSSLPPLKSPMAGTFYRSPAPGEPPFVKVGDKVKKGQVICIIEAMKLMNEIELTFHFCFSEFRLRHRTDKDLLFFFGSHGATIFLIGEVAAALFLLTWADQSGTVVEIVAEDAKPVSVDTQIMSGKEIPYSQIIKKWYKPAEMGSSTVNAEPNLHLNFGMMLSNISLHHVYEMINNCV